MASIKVGDIYSTNEGCQVEVIEYENALNIKVMYLDAHKHVANVRSGNLKNGCIKNPFFPSVFGKGYKGLGPYKLTENSKETPEGSTWRSMIRRVYYDAYKANQPTYAQCSLYEEWHNFQNFAEWFHQQPNAGRRGFALDKDLMVIGNKVYAPEFCSFVPQAINNLLTDHSSLRGDYPQGVCKRGGRYLVYLSKEGEQEIIGSYKNPEDAFNCYVKNKKEQVIITANKYKHYINETVYNNLINWDIKYGSINN